MNARAPYRHNLGSSLTQKANRALRPYGCNVKVKSSGYMRGGTVTGDTASLMLAHLILGETAGISVSAIMTYSWGTQFHLAFSEDA